MFDERAMSESGVMGQKIHVNIRNLAVGGAGVGEVVAQFPEASNSREGEGASQDPDDLLGITAFVPFSVMGELVSAQVVEQKQRYVKADFLSVEGGVPERCEPACRYFMTCGSCELQHIEYATQLKAKHSMIAGALKSARLPARVIERLEPLVPSSPYGYRRRISLHVDSGGRIGFYRQNSRSVVSIESCSIATERINAALVDIQEFGRKVAGTISSLLLEDDTDGIVAVLKAPYALNASQQKKVLDAAKDHFKNAMLLVAGKEVGGFGRQILELPLNSAGTFSLRVPAGHFSQVNAGVNVKLIDGVLEAAADVRGEPLYDLYAGAGNFAIPLARMGAKVTAVEIDSRLVNFGRENAARYGLGDRVNYVEMSVEKFLASKKGKHDVGTLVLDPPRSGIGRLVSQCNFGSRIIMVSCHVPSFVRDVKALVEMGWDCKKIVPYDMFSQTSYVEVLSVLERS